MLRIGLAACAAVLLVALTVVLAPGVRASDGVSVAALGGPDRAGPSARPPEAIALEACLGQKGARQAAKCIGAVAEACVKRAESASPQAQTECFRREAEGWSTLLAGYRVSLEKRLASDERRLAELREGDAVWAAERAKYCAAASPSEPCDMRERGRRALQLRLLAEQAGATR